MSGATLEHATLDEQLLALLVCPISKQPLVYFAAEQKLFSPTAKVLYAVVDGLAVLLAEEATKLDDAEAAVWAKRSAAGVKTGTAATI
jgi:uncharacterized protein